MVLLVLSRRSGFDWHKAICETWAKDQPTVYFIVGDHNCAVPNHFHVKKREPKGGAGVCGRTQEEDRRGYGQGGSSAAVGTG